VCWRKKYVLRAISVLVASPLDCSWDDFRKALRTAWAQTTAASNWMMTELYVGRSPRRRGKDAADGAGLLVPGGARALSRLALTD